MKALAAAASTDAGVWRSFWRTMNLLEPPTTLMQPEFLAAVAAAAARATPSDAVSVANMGPTRADLNARLGGIDEVDSGLQ